MRTSPRLVGRNWQTDIVKPGHLCGLPAVMSALSVPKWNCTSGVASSGRVLANMQPCWMPTASGPLRKNAHFMPISAWLHSVRNWSLVVIGLVHLNMTRI
ncbi:hypothetical protein D9M71_753890 [compost metagenome]